MMGDSMFNSFDESEEDGFVFEEDDDMHFGDKYSPNSYNSSPLRQYDMQPCYRVLSIAQIQTVMEEAVAVTCDVLGVTPEMAHFLLGRNKWQSDRLCEDWVESSIDVLKKAGFSTDVAQKALYGVAPEGNATESNLEEPNDDFYCTIMADKVKFNETASLSCGHRFSNDAWEGYLDGAASDNNVVAIADKRCPMPDCPFFVSDEFWKRYLSEGKYCKYKELLIKWYVETNAHLVWCPAPDCTYAIELFNTTKTDVICRCGNQFCFLCSEEPHFPIPCCIIRLWHEKNCNEADNVTWILVNTKICKGCKQPIEKNQGCMHMTCRCGYEFCWLCETEWNKHSSNNAYRCNVYEQSEKDAGNNERRKAKESLERYTHFYERYRAHNSAQKLAYGEQMDQIKAHMDLLHNVVGEIIDVDFLRDAVLQIIACRRMLKWSYAYGYFADWSARSEPGAAKNLFEHHQGQLERTLETLHEMTEKFDPESFVGECRESFGPLFEFKSSLVNITRVVKDFFQKMAEAFETDFM